MFNNFHIHTDLYDVSQDSRDLFLLLFRQFCVYEHIHYT